MDMTDMVEKRKIISFSKPDDHHKHNKKAANKVGKSNFIKSFNIFIAKDLCLFAVSEEARFHSALLLWSQEM